MIFIVGGKVAKTLRRCAVPDAALQDAGEFLAEKQAFLHIIKLTNQYGRVFHDKLTCLYLEMPDFIKSEGELENRLDQWLYFLKNLQAFSDMPTIFKDDVLEQAFEKAELANMAPAERDKYEASLKVYRDLKNVIDTACDEGIEQGILEGARKTAKQPRNLGVSVEIIM